jgi:membrane protease YdiL (CAAX protease family)
MNTTTTRPRTAQTRNPAVPQYSRGQILGIWAAVTIPMSVLGWVVAPWAAHHVVHSRDPFIDSLVVAFDIGLLWMITLVLIVVRREQGSLAWAKVKDALWLHAPLDPNSGLGWRRVWLWAVLFTIGTGVVNALPIDPTGPLPRDLPRAILTDRVEHYFSGNWIGFGLMVLNAFAAPIAEEMVFRGLLLPRTQAVFGRGNVIANSALFTLFHLHQPWGMPATLIDGAINQAYPTQRFGSTWLGIITHTAPSFLVCGTILILVLN